MTMRIFNMAYGVQAVFLDEVFEEMMISAMRYALGRMTYIVKDTTDYIGSLVPLLSNDTLFVMRNDIISRKEEEERGNKHAFGMDCDRECWLGLLERIEQEQKTRKENA